MTEDSRKELDDAIKSLLSSADYSDLVITCGKDIHKVHKAIVCTRSEFFRRAEGFGKEALEGKIDLPEDEPALISLLMQYLYEGEYEPKLPPPGDLQHIPSRLYVSKKPNHGFHYKFPHTCTPDDCSTFKVCHHHTCGTDCDEDCKDFVCNACLPRYRPALAPMPGASHQIFLHAQMYELADKYGVVGLKPLATAKFDRACTYHWDSEHFAPAAYHAFSSTPATDKNLRMIVSKTVAENISLLNKAAVRAVVDEYKEIALDVLELRATDLGWTKT